MAKQSAFHQPDAAAVEQAIRQNRWTTTEIVLHLAWNAGLSRKEIYDLTWEQVDLDAALLHLPNRDVPLPEDTVKALTQWNNRFANGCEYVAVSKKYRTRVADVYISNMVRIALNAVEQKEVQLKDLRYDYILRQIEEHSVSYALRVSGLTLISYNNVLSKRYKGAGIDLQRLKAEKLYQPPKISNWSENESRLWQLMQQEKDTPGGIALWLTQQMGLKEKDIVSLTWDDVDFAAGTLRVQDEIQTMPRSITRILRQEFDRRRPEDDPHVILSVQSRKSPSPERLGVLIRELLIRGGLDDVSALDIRMGMLREVDWKILRAWVNEHGSIVPGEAGQLLGIGDRAAWQRLNRLKEMGYLVHIGHKYYSAEKTPSEDKLKEAIYQHISENGGPISCRDAAERLGIPPRQIGYILRNMVAAGELSAPSWGKYGLTE